MNIIPVSSSKQTYSGGLWYIEGELYALDSEIPYAEVYKNMPVVAADGQACIWSGNEELSSLTKTLYRVNLIEEGQDTFLYNKVKGKRLSNFPVALRLKMQQNYSIDPDNSFSRNYVVDRYDIPADNDITIQIEQPGSNESKCLILREARLYEKNGSWYIETGKKTNTREKEFYLENGCVTTNPSEGSRVALDLYQEVLAKPYAVQSNGKRYFQEAYRIAQPGEIFFADKPTLAKQKTYSKKLILRPATQFISDDTGFEETGEVRRPYPGDYYLDNTKIIRCEGQAPISPILAKVNPTANLSNEIINLVKSVFN